MTTTEEGQPQPMNRADVQQLVAHLEQQRDEARAQLERERRISAGLRATLNQINDEEPKLADALEDLAAARAEVRIADQECAYWKARAEGADGALDRLRANLAEVANEEIPDPDRIFPDHIQWATPDDAYYLGKKVGQVEFARALLAGEENTDG